MTRIFKKFSQLKNRFNGVTVVETSQWTLLGVLGEGCPRPLLQLVGSLRNYEDDGNVKKQ